MSHPGGSEERLARALAALAGSDRPPHLAPALDVACGRGRHALLLARHGIETAALDADPEAIAWLAAEAGREGVEVAASVADLERPGFTLDEEAYGLVVVVHYLHRPLCPALARALRPGGILFYETFTVDQPRFGRPNNPAYLLEHGELLRLFPSLEVIEHREGEVEGPSAKATLLARRP